MFDNLKEEDSIKIIIKDECIGDGEFASEPSKYVKTATIQLRKKLSLANGCENCREMKKRVCQNVPQTNHIYRPFEAILRIIYQIRCNLFHGNKLVLFGAQFIRDKKLVKASNSILSVVLNTIYNL